MDFLTLLLEKIAPELAAYGVSVDSAIVIKLNKYIELLDSWNRKIALTAVVDPIQVVRFHFGESLFALQLASFDHGRLADVGSGAGFPGLAIKLFRLELSVVLLEPNKKKCAFLHEVVRSLDLRDVEVLPVRYEDAHFASGSFNFVTSRALGKSDDMLLWASKTLSREGSVLLWLSAVDAESVRKLPGWVWNSPRLIPGSENRSILCGSISGKIR